MLGRNGKGEPKPEEFDRERGFYVYIYIYIDNRLDECGRCNLHGDWNQILPDMVVDDWLCNLLGLPWFDS